jgi:hypothetical protein
VPGEPAEAEPAEAHPDPQPTQIMRPVDGGGEQGQPTRFTHSGGELSQP